ncbi:hypothetical protein [Haloarchaeobius sp. DYHT-AS-18]|uniref:hypothetical protein n=1 Tax=Haloarchaeobius sp. DYHT-AS-18 TaxID=3446117 RepID=UPI003EB946A9
MTGDSDVSRLRRVLTVFAVLVIIGQVAVAPVAAGPDGDGFAGDHCGRDAAGILVDVVLLDWDKSIECEQASQYQTLTVSDGYQTALALEDLQNGSIIPIRNHLETSKTFARTVAKSEAVKAFNNNSTRAEAKTRVNESLAELYTNMQLNTLETYGANVNQTWYVVQAYQDAGLISGYDSPLAVRAVSTADGEWPWGFSGSIVNGYDTTFTYENATFTLLDGSNTSIPVLNTSDAGYSNPMDGSHDHPVVMTVHPDNWTGTDHNGENADDFANLLRSAPYDDTLGQIQTTHDDVQTNAMTYVDSLYDTYNTSEELNVTEVLDPITLASQWNTNEETTGSYGWLAAELGLGGLNGSINQSFYINYTPASNHTATNEFDFNGTNNTTYAFETGQSYNISGTMFTDWLPASTNGSFILNQTYNTSNAAPPVLFVQQTDDGTRVVELDGQFTITNLVNVRTGEQVNQTAPEQVNLQTWNASSTKQELQMVLEYRDNITRTYDTGGGGGGVNLGGISLGGASIGALVAIAGILYVADRSSSAS